MAENRYIGSPGTDGGARKFSHGIRCSGRVSGIAVLSGRRFRLSEPVAEDILKAYFPLDSRSDKKLAALQKYIDSLAEIFPDLGKPSFTTETICDPDWGEQWKKYFKPIRVSNNIVVEPTWERYTPSSRDIVIEIDPGMAFGTGQHASTRMCIEAVEEISS